MVPTVLGDHHRSLASNNKPDWIFLATSFFLDLLATLFCLGSAIFLVWHRKNPIISLSQPRFLGIAFVASAVVAGSGYFLLAAHLGGTNEDRSDRNLGAMCSACVWCFVLGHNIVYMALFGKLWRIQKVCQIRRHQIVTVQQTIWPLRLMVAINICILSAWMAVDPPEYIALETVKGTYVGTCNFVQPLFMVPIQLLLFVSACLGLWMTYKTKDLPGDLNDGGKIYHVYLGNTATLLATGGLYWTGLFLQKPIMINFGISLALFLTSMTSVAPLAIPKMYYVWYQKKYNKLPEGVGSIGVGAVHVKVSADVAAASATVSTANRTSVENARASAIQPPTIEMGPLPPELKKVEEP